MPIGKGNMSPMTWTQQLYLEGQLPEEMPPKQKPFDSLEFILRFEGGDLDERELIEGFQELIDSRLAWVLQDMYGRLAMRLIEAGVCHSKN